MRFIKSLRSESTGGNCMADLLTLTDGRVVFITDECFGACASEKEWSEGASEDFPMVCDSFDRAARADALNPLTFVQTFDDYEPDGPVSVDLVILHDFRVIGIDSESAVLYPHMSAFLDCDGTKDYPAISLPATAQ